MMPSAVYRIERFRIAGGRLRQLSLAMSAPPLKRRFVLYYCSAVYIRRRAGL
jgi:hypothetical protein